VVGSNIGVSWVCYYGTSYDFDGIVLCWISSGIKEEDMIGNDWMIGEDARMEYEVVEDDSDIDWDDPSLIADVFDQTDTKFDKIVNKVEQVLFGKYVHYAAGFIGGCLSVSIVIHLVRWIW
jgi:hypothetical protein